jgi:hypothetical protein
MDATVIGVPLASLSIEQLYRLRDLVNAEANARCGLPPLLFRLTYAAPSVDVLWRPLMSVAVVTQLLTRQGRAVVVATGRIPAAWTGLRISGPVHSDGARCWPPRFSIGLLTGT